MLSTLKPVTHYAILYKITKCARYSDCDFRRSPRSGENRYLSISGMSDISGLHSPCVPFRAIFYAHRCESPGKVNQSGWAILSHDFSKWRIAAIRWSLGTRLKCHIAKCVRINRLVCRRLKPATHLAILYADRGEFDRQRKSQPIFATN